MMSERERDFGVRPTATIAEALEYVSPAARAWLAEWLASCPDERACDGPRDCVGTDRGCVHCAPGEFRGVLLVLADLVAEDPE